MSLQAITNVNIDFYNKKYILVNAKQLDKSSRFLSVTCYNRGEIYPVNASSYSAYIRCKKPDNYSVFNFCDIDSSGKIIVELTEQMLASSGICDVDLVIVDKGSAKIDSDTGEIVLVSSASILSSMVFHIDVSEMAVANSDIESSYEFNGFNAALEKAEAEYTEVIRLAKSYAVGNADGIRENEDYDNAKYYYEQSLKNASNAKTSESNASISEQNAKQSEINASVSEANASTSEQNAKLSETNAKASESNALVSEQNAKESENSALSSENNAKTSENNALVSEQNAKNSETIAVNSGNVAKSYAVGGTGTRENENVDNAHYYYEMVKNVVNGLNSGFIPMGTISFSELATVEKATGFTYNISDDFVTDENFAEGEGMNYTAGTNVYVRSDGLFDCLGGSTSSVASVDEVKSYLGI